MAMLGADLSKSRPSSPRSQIWLSLLGQFSVTIDDTRVNVAPSGQRLLAGVAIAGGRRTRSSLASLLWPDRPSTRSLANLRSAVSRLPTTLRKNLDCGTRTIAFNHRWEVDLNTAAAVSDEVVRPGFRGWFDSELLKADVLPDWDDDWLIVERERFRQRRLHALESAAKCALDDGRPLDAVDLALLALGAEPLRESAQRLVIAGHIAAGNQAAALRSFAAFQQLLQDELSLSPTPQLVQLIERL